VSRQPRTLEAALPLAAEHQAFCNECGRRGLAAAGGVVTPGTAEASSTAWRQVYQADASGSFEQIAVISNHNVWGVGDTSTKAGKTHCAILAAWLTTQHGTGPSTTR
jgi:hypothetical protein